MERREPDANENPYRRGRKKSADPAYMKWPALQKMLWDRIKANNDVSEKGDGTDFIFTDGEVGTLLGWAQTFDRAAQPRRDEEQKTYDLLRSAAALLDDKAKSKPQFLGIFEGPMGVVNRYPSDLPEAFEQTRALIQEAKGADGPSGGFVTDHLDFAEHWLDKAESLALSGKNPCMTFEQAWAEKEAAGYQYGADALEQVKFGWEIALAAMGRIK